MHRLPVFLLLILLVSCRGTNLKQTRYTADGPYGPVLVAHGSERTFNRIGTVRATSIKGEERIYIDPTEPTIYHQQVPFETANGRYQNDIYRFHFERVPAGHLAAGRNVGVFVIVTSSESGPLLVTTVHTCGCYVGIVPTSLLPAAALPKTWKTGHQRVYGERLPRLLTLDEPSYAWRPEVHLRPDSHRVMTLASATEVPPLATTVPIASLDQLPLGPATTSMFYQRGRRQGYVKDSRKPLERILMSWWALDPYIGRDKAMGDHAKTGTRFYTSIRFWLREETDLWHFADWLAFHGWRL